jgi:hypothetical protein
VLDASLSMASLGVPYVAMMGCTVAVCVCDSRLGASQARGHASVSSLSWLPGVGSRKVKGAADTGLQQIPRAHSR